MNGHVNGNGAAGNAISAMPRIFLPGIRAPIPAFFFPGSEDLDVPTFKAHVVRLASAGVGPLISGSMGEAIHLSHAERVTLIKAARSALDDAGFEAVPIMAGVGAGSTRETIELCQDAAVAGADLAIAIVSGYFAGALKGNKEALKAFFVDVSEKSPIPLLVYSYPGASGGIELDSDLITEIAIDCPNSAGVKLTCGDVGKLTRICATVSPASFTSTHPRKNTNAPFLVFGGFADFILAGAASGGHGAIVGLGNVAPHALVRLFELSEASKTNPSLLPEAQHLQGIIARGDYTIAKAGISGTKFLMEKLYGYGGLCRRPLLPIPPAVAQALWDHPHTQELVRVERELSGKVKSAQ